VFGHASVDAFPVYLSHLFAGDDFHDKKTITLLM
jgi:hypothetical protein